MVDTTAPIPLRYEGAGEFRAPSPAWEQHCDQRLVTGQVYRFVEEEQRSAASHNHQFAWIDDAYDNLPDELCLQFTSKDNLRKHALIMTGWCHERRLAASSKAEARKIAAFMMNGRHEYALFSVVDSVVIERTAKSQKTRGPERMNKAEFQKSKQDVIDWIEDYVRAWREAHSPSPSIAPDHDHADAERERTNG